MLWISHHFVCRWNGSYNSIHPLTEFTDFTKFSSHQTKKYCTKKRKKRIKGAPKLETEIIFVSLTKTDKITTSILNCHFSHDTLTLWHIKQTMCIQKYKFNNRNNIYLVFSSLKIQRRLVQIKVLYKLFTLPKKKQITKLLLATAKNIFYSLYVIGKTSFDKCFLFHVRTGRYSFL